MNEKLIPGPRDIDDRKGIIDAKDNRKKPDEPSGNSGYTDAKFVGTGKNS